MGGGGDGHWRKKIKNADLGGKMNKWKGKKGENCITRNKGPKVKIVSFSIT